MPESFGSGRKKKNLRKRFFLYSLEAEHRYIPVVYRNLNK